MTGYLLRPAYGAPASLGAPPVGYRRSVEAGLLIERDVPVRLRHGATMYIDVFRPPDGPPVPPIIAWSPYGKHRGNDPRMFPGAGLEHVTLSPYCAFEAPDPAWWVPRGYAVIVADKPGTWHSEGLATYMSPEEGEDFSDLIEWAGTQAWSNGRVGLSGVSYLTQSQWHVAALAPPHLAAINCWEGWSDTYREVARHGGIPDTSFWPYLWARWGIGEGEIEDLAAETAAHPLYDDFWRSKVTDFSRITVPAFIVASWSDQGLHTRGTLEGFKRIASADKWLEIHGRKKWQYYYEPASVARLEAFFDRFLRGNAARLDGWPRVRLEVRERHGVGAMRDEAEWPLARTRYVPLHLDAASGRMERPPARSPAACRYDATDRAVPPAAACFDHVFERATELVGPMKLKLHLAIEGGDDADLFVGLRKLDRAGNVVPFMYYAMFDDGPVALGWLRASHRALDPARSTPWQPVLAHGREDKLAPGEIVPLEIEIWPSGTRFEAGEGLRLIIQGSDLNQYPAKERPVYFRHEDSVNRGYHVLYTGGAHDSHLLIPVTAEGA